MSSRILLAWAVLFCASCGSADLERTAERRDSLLHTLLVTGGDAPMAQSLVFFADGTIRLRTAGEKPRWKRLSESDKQRVETFVGSAAFKSAIEALPRNFACCDERELAVSFRKTADRLDTVQNPPSISLSSTPPGASVLHEFVALRDRIGRHYFGRRYWQVSRS